MRPRVWQRLHPLEVELGRELGERLGVLRRHQLAEAVAQWVACPLRLLALLCQPKQGSSADSTRDDARAPQRMVVRGTSAQCPAR